LGWTYTLLTPVDGERVMVCYVCSTLILSHCTCYF